MGWFDDVFDGVGDFFEGAGDILDDVSGIAQYIPGPIGTAAKVYNVGKGLFSKPKNPAGQVNGMLQQGANSQMAYQQQALDQYQRNMDRSLASGIADKQIGYDLARNQFINQQQNLRPFKQANQGMLQQSAPALQYLLGLTPTKMDNGFSEYTPPNINYMDKYRQAGDDLTEGYSSSAPASIYDNAMQQPMNNQVGGGVVRSEPLENYKYDITESPAYKWQREQMNEKLQGQLAASGLAGSTYGQRELARNERALAANETDKTINRLSGIYTNAMSNANMGNLTFTPPTGGNTGNIYGQMAQGTADIYGNMGNIQGQLGAQMAQNQMAGYNAMTQGKNSQPSALSTGLDMAHSLGWLNNGSRNIDSAFNAFDSSLNDFGSVYDNAWNDFDNMEFW